MRRKPIFRRRDGRLRRRVRWVVVLLGAAWIGMAGWHGLKPLPDGLDAAFPMRPVGEIRFLADYSYTDPSGERHVEQAIFDRALELINQAERLIVLDMFLFNDFAGQTSGDDLRPLSAEVAAAIVNQRRRHPGLRAIVITDPINTFYGSFELEQLKRLRAAGAEVVITNLRRLPASNPVWSGLWRVCCQWFGLPDGGGWLPNPMGTDAVALRSLLALLNFKANHRKTLVVDRGDGWVGLVTSANAHDASSAHSNIAVEFTGPAVRDLLATERPVARFSAPSLDWPELSEPSPEPRPPSGTGPRIRILTESAIRDAVLERLGSAGPGDRIDIAMFYLAHRGVIEALIGAHRRGATVRALLDPNKDAFGRKKSGIPNRSVAAELVDAGIEVRWCNTTGEQCHDKLVLVREATGRADVIAGSANFTRRNLDGFNLETDVHVAASTDSPFIGDVTAWFERRFGNQPGRIHSVPYRQYAAEGWLRYWRYRFMEATGLSTF